MLDTGATNTLISPAVLVYAGYNPTTAQDRTFITAATGTIYLPRIKIERFEALRTSRSGLRVLAHTLPPSAGVDGLLGLDFFRGRQLTIDFHKGLVTLAD